MPRRLVALIVTFNRLDKLRQTLARTLENSFHRVVVVDNASTDGTGEWLDSLGEARLDVLHSDTNLGGAGGFHLGFCHVARDIPEAEWLVCFDDDAWPEADVADRFAALEIPADAGTLAAAVYLPDGERISEMNRPSRNPFWHLREFFGAALRGRHGFHLGAAAYRADALVDVDASSFVGCFIRLALIREGRLGLPRSELFIYADDIIYVLEARRAGYRHLFAPTLRFRHDCATLVEQRDVYHPLWRVYYTFRNRLEVYRIASGWFYPFILLVKIPAFLLKYRYYPKFERRKYLAIIARAIWDGVRRDYRKRHEDVLRLAALEPGGGAN